MHPILATELATARHAELLRDAENRRSLRLARGARPAGRPALAALAAGAGMTQRLRMRAAQLIALGSPRQSILEPCC